MIGRFLVGPYGLVEPWLQHPSWPIRRGAQAAVLGIAGVWLLLSKFKAGGGGAAEREDEFIERLVSSGQLREFLHGPGVLRRPLSGRVFRALLFRLSTAANARAPARAHDRTFAIRLAGPIDQVALRNLLIWQNHVLPSPLVRHEGGQVDVTLLLAGGSVDEAQLFDLVSVLLMLERICSFALVWHEEVAGVSVASEQQASPRPPDDRGSDLAQMPRGVIRRIELNGSDGGIKLLPPGRKRANDFFKLTLPGRLVIAVGLRERADGTVDPGELDSWLASIDRQHARHPDVAFVLLNRLAPSQWREWPAHLRFARHQGLTLQDVICLAQIADGYLGVLDVLGLAAHSAGRSGVYVPLEDHDLPAVETGAEFAEQR